MLATTTVIESPPAPSLRLVTGEELAQRPDSELCELVEGRIVRMSPTSHLHGRIEGNFYWALTNWAKPRKLGRLLVGEVGLYIRRNPDTVRAADVAFISAARYAQVRSASYLDVAPELVVEVLSPDDSWQAVMKKVADYFACGVQAVWVADPESQSVYAYHSATEAKQFNAGDTLTAPELLPEFSVTVAELFAE